MNRPDAPADTVREAQSDESYDPTVQQKAAAKLSSNTVKGEQRETHQQPHWIRVEDD